MVRFRRARGDFCRCSPLAVWHKHTIAIRDASPSPVPVLCNGPLELEASICFHLIGITSANGAKMEAPKRIDTCATRDLRQIGRLIDFSNTLNPLFWCATVTFALCFVCFCFNIRKARANANSPGDSIRRHPSPSGWSD